MTPAVFAHGHLRLYLLSLLAVAPMHGYEIIQALEERSGGTYTPSAGTIYPRLAKLEEEGLVTKSTEGRKTTYEITAAGREELEERKNDLHDIENDLTDSVRRLADEVRSSVDQAMKSLRAELAAAAREARSDARQAGRTVRTNTRDVSSGLLRDAEMALNEFRHHVRTELRGMAARDTLTTETVQTLTAKLAEARAGLFHVNL